MRGSVVIDNATASADGYGIRVRFNRSVKVSTLVKSHFRLFYDSATPSEITNAFKDIVVCDDFDSIRRTLTLKSSVQMLPSTSYTLHVDGVEVAGVGSIINEAIDFVTQDAYVVEPVPDPVYIEDHSIKSTQDIEIIEGSGGVSVTGLRLLDSTPSDDDYFIETDFNDGRIILSFSKTLATGSLDASLMKVQRKKNQIIPTRWETIDTNIAADLASSNVDRFIVTVDLPAIDDELIYFQNGHEYFEEGYIYRVQLSRYIETEDGLQHLSDNITISFSSGFLPLLVDPESLAPYAEEASLIEIALMVNRFSIEVEKLFPNGDYPDVAYDYIQAATLCSLSRLYDGISADSSGSLFMLGDLRVSNSKSSGTGHSSRGNVSSWCQLAEVLRRETRAVKGSLVSSVKAGNRYSPIRSRMLHRAEFRPRNNR